MHAAESDSSYLLLDRDSIAQVNGQLSYVDKHVSVSQADVNAANLNQRTLHQLYERQRRRRCKLAVSYIRSIQKLHSHINQHNY